jgi:hypothetical protein
MSMATTKVGGGSIFYYTVDTTTTLSAPSALVTADVADVTDLPTIDLNFATFQETTAYSLQIATVGLDATNGGLAMTALATALSYTTGAGAVGLDIDLTIPAGALGIAIFVDGQLVAIWPNAPANRAAGTGSSRTARIYYPAVSNALLATNSEIGVATVYGITRNSLPDTTDETTINMDKDLVEITPTHAANYQIVSGSSMSCDFTVYTYENNVRALALGALLLTDGSKEHTLAGYRASTTPRSRPFEVHVPGETNQNDVYFIMTGTMETEPFSASYGKATKPGIKGKITGLPDTYTEGVFPYWIEAYQ